MPDMPIFAFILLGVLLFVFAGIAFFFFVYDHRAQYYRYEDDALMTGKDFFCEFRCFGGMENEDLSLKLVYGGGENAKLYYRDTTEQGTRSKRKIYIVPQEAVTRLKEIYRKHCVPVLSDAPQREEFALDAPTTLVCFSTAEDEEQKSYTVTTSQELPAENRGLFHEVETLLRSYLPHDRRSAAQEK